jgi:hypothetical protein
MPTRNMSACKNHHHKRGTDCYRGKRAGAVADDRIPNGQNQKESPDELTYLLCLLIKTSVTRSGTRSRLNWASFSTKVNVMQHDGAVGTNSP